MRPIAAAVLFFASATTSVLAAPCATSPTRLCLNAGRFAVDVTWTDFQSHTGSGQAVALTGDTGYFWFFSPNNVELVVKVVDGRGFNSAFWVFYGALSNVAYTMTVTDSVTGAIKTYTNPSGTFGSVGDTSAFPSSGPARSAHVSRRNVEATDAYASSLEMALRESLLTASPSRARAATAAPTCVGTDTSLCLNGGRFRVEVNWTDFAGKTGVGTAVGLTGDTGYFWFFSSNNVELTVKVLDARVLNGRFWVFYGALSNVRYAMTVTDTLTGVVHTYSNPSGQFASVGDTEGFQTGFSVAAQLDVSHASSKTIPAEGGTLSATAADGTVFTLTLPDGALLAEEEITLTPVTTVDRLPLSGGLVAGVQLAPEGLLLFQPATLVITPPTAVPVNEETTFAWRGSGEEFFLYPPVPLGTASVSMSVSHLCGYGVGRGTSADLSVQQGRLPANRVDKLAQALQDPAAEQRRAARGGSAIASRRPMDALRLAKTPAQDKATRVLGDFLSDWIVPNEPITCDADWRGFLNALSDFQISVLNLTGPDPVLFKAARDYHDAVFALLKNCYNTDYDRCKSDHDPSQGVQMLSILQAFKQDLSQGQLDRTKIGKCVSFELTFDSTINEPFIAGAPFAFRHRLKAVIPFHYQFPGDPTGVDVFTADLLYLTADFAGGTGDPKCTLTTSGAKSIFQISNFFLDFNAFVGGSALPSVVRIEYDPGFPEFTSTIACEGAPAITLTQPRWRSLYEANRGEIGGPFVAEDWKFGLTGIYAFKFYDQGAGLGVEVTKLEMRHTPQ